MWVIHKCTDIMAVGSRKSGCVRHRSMIPTAVPSFFGMSTAIGLYGLQVTSSGRSNMAALRQRNLRLWLYTTEAYIQCLHLGFWVEHDQWFWRLYNQKFSMAVMLGNGIRGTSLSVLPWDNALVTCFIWLIG